MKSLAIAAPKLPFHSHRLNHTYQFNKFQCGSVFVPRTILKPPILYFHRRCYGETHISSAGRGYRLNVNGGSHAESYWLNLIRDGIWSIRSVLVFLVEQPSQLSYVEWPSFQSTVSLSGTSSYWFIRILLLHMLISRNLSPIGLML